MKFKDLFHWETFSGENYSLNALTMSRLWTGCSVAGGTSPTPFHDVSILHCQQLANTTFKASASKCIFWFVANVEMQKP